MKSRGRQDWRVAVVWARRLIALASTAHCLAAVYPAQAQQADGTTRAEETQGSQRSRPNGGAITQPSIICCGGGGGGGGGGGSGTYDSAPIAPEKFLRSPGGVDMRTGQLLYSHTDLSIGGDKGLQLIRHFSPVTNGVFTAGTMGGFSHNWDIRVSEKRIKTPTATSVQQHDYQVAVAGPRTKTYRAQYDPEPGDFSSFSDGLYTWLEFQYVVHPITHFFMPTQYTYRDSNGLRIAFRPTGSQYGGGEGCGIKCAFAAQVSDADGTTYTLSYDTNSAGVVRLRSVRSNRGYALLFEYGPSGVSKACALNLAYTVMPSIATEQVCPAGVLTSTYTYNSAGRLVGFTDQSGVASHLGPDGSALYWPGESTPYVTNTIVQGVYTAHVAAQSFADGRSYTYNWEYDGNIPVSMIAGGSYTDNNGKTVSAHYGKYKHGTYDPTWYVTDGPETATDELGRSWTYYYGCAGTAFCGPTPLQRATEPEQNKTLFTRDYYGNVTEKRHVAKPGSGLADIVESASFYCLGLINCNKPISKTDANGHTTNYTYDPVHGGLLTAMGPAPAAGGARPLTVNTYAQRYAWTRNSSGVLTQETVPVWVLSSTTVCQTAAGTNPSPLCDASAPETVTTYQYGANGSAESLLVKGMAVSSGGTTLRTCYTYDQDSRKIGETRPNANLSVCP
jgi:hypothetical protein